MKDNVISKLYSVCSNFFFISAPEDPPSLIGNMLSARVRFEIPTSKALLECPRSKQLRNRDTTLNPSERGIDIRPWSKDDNKRRVLLGR